MARFLSSSPWYCQQKRIHYIYRLIRKFVLFSKYWSYSQLSQSHPFERCALAKDVTAFVLLFIMFERRSSPCFEKQMALVEGKHSLALESLDG